MTPVKTTANLIAVLAMSCCLVPVSWGQAAAQGTAPAQGAAAAKSTAPAPKTSRKKKPAAAAQSTAPEPSAQADAKPDAKPDVAGKRDPFVPLVNDKKPSGPPLPPGKAGLVIATVRVDGTVKAANGMLAVVTNPDQDRKSVV